MNINRKTLLKFFIIAAFAFAFLLLLYFYGIKPKKDIKIIFIIKTVDSSVAFWNNVNLGMQTAAKEYGITLIVDGPEKENQVDIQNECILKAIEEKPDIIILAAASYTSQLELCHKIVDSGIMLITLDSDIDSEVATGFVGTNNFEAGKSAGEALSEIISDEDKTVIISFVEGSAPAIDRERGALAGLNPKQKENVVGTYFCNSNEEEAYNIMSGVLNDMPQVTSVVCLNEQGTSGAARAIKDYGAEGIKMVGIDSSFTAIKALEEGIINTLVVQKPFNMGYLGIVNAMDAFNGKKIERFIDTGAQVITKETMYLKENQKLLFIFADVPEM